MDYNYKQTNLSKAIFGGLFAGLIACAAAEIFNIIFRLSTGFSSATFINVETLIFAPVIFCVIAGILYFILTKFVKKGRLIYIVLFVLITVAGVVMGFMRHYTSSGPAFQKALVLHTGIVLIIGCTAAFVQPYVTKHDVLNE